MRRSTLCSLSVRNVMTSIVHGTGSHALSVCVATSLLFCAAAGAQEPTTIADGVYAIVGAGGAVTGHNLGRVANVAFVVGPRGVVVVDSGVSHRHGEAIIDAVRRVTPLPIRLLVLTHPSQEVVLGAAAFQEQRIAVLMHRDAAALMASRCGGCIDSLTMLLGAYEMIGTRVVRPDRLIDGTLRLDVIGRPLRVISSGGSSAPGALSVLDETTATLMAGSVASIDSVPDVRDGDSRTWKTALDALQATHCASLVPSYGRIGSCADIPAFESYLDALDARIRELLRAGVGLAEVGERAALPQFAQWSGYDDRHAANANRVYLRLERAAFE